VNFDFSLESLFSWQILASIIDVLIVTFVIYQLIKIVRGTKVNELLKGILIILLIKFISSVFQLQTTEYIVDFVIQWSALALIIIFQPELRRGLEHLGRGSVFSKKRKTNPSEELAESLTKSVQYMSKRRIGALISIEMETGLDDYIETGIPMNSDISSELLINIFIPNTPLHDGAVIIKDYQVASAASYLPLSESSTIPKKLGTRHRAAIGLSEVTDAVTIVVSEETGEVSISRRGNLTTEMSIDDFREYLDKNIVQHEDDEKSQGRFEKIIKKFRKGAFKE